MADREDLIPLSQTPVSLSSSQIFMLDPVFKGRDNYDQLVKITQVGGCVC